MFVLAPATRFGYFIYPGGILAWLIVSLAGQRAPHRGRGRRAAGRAGGRGGCAPLIRAVVAGLSAVACRRLAAADR